MAKKRTNSKKESLSLEGINDLKNIWITEDLNIVADSRWIAQCYGKDNGHLLRDIRELRSIQNWSDHSAVELSYIDQWNRSQPYYLLTYEAFDLLTGSYTGEAKIITQKIKERFRELDRELACRKMLSSPEHLLQVTQLYYEKAKEVEQLKNQIAIEAPKVELSKIYEKVEGEVNIGEVAHLADDPRITQKLLFKILTEGTHPYIKKSGKSYKVLYRHNHAFIDSLFVQKKTMTTGGFYVNVVRMTQKGIGWLIAKAKRYLDAEDSKKNNTLMFS